MLMGIQLNDKLYCCWILDELTRVKHKNLVVIGFLKIVNVCM